MERQKNRTAEVISKKESYVGAIRLPQFKTYNIAVIIKTGLHWRRDRYIDEWNREPRNRLTQIGLTGF